MRRPQRVLIAGDDVVHRWDLAQTLVAQGLSVVGQDSVGPTRWCWPLHYDRTSSWSSWRPITQLPARRGNHPDPAADHHRCADRDEHQGRRCHLWVPGLAGTAIPGGQVVFW